jgi:hypothetical protein
MFVAWREATTIGIFSPADSRSRLSQGVGRLLHSRVLRMSSAPRFRSPTFYRAALALPVAVLAVLLATGRLQASFAMFSPGSPIPETAFRDGMIMNLIWLAAIAPLSFGAWDLGRHHVAGRRLNYAFLVGLRDVVRIAFGTKPAEAVAAYARPARDRPGQALLIGVAVAIVVPALFLSAAPFLRSGPAAAWLAGTGVIIGSVAYAQRRAAAYLRDEPGRWNPLRQYQLMNPARYEPGGQPFVRWQLAGTLLLMVWWIGGGVFVLSLPHS